MRKSVHGARLDITHLLSRIIDEDRIIPSSPYAVTLNIISISLKSTLKSFQFQERDSRLIKFASASTIYNLQIPRHIKPSKN